MLIPLVLGYVVGAVGFYTLLSKTAPVIKVEGTSSMTGAGEHSEVIELFPDQEEQKAA
ncbi:MAG: hypothetical protein QE269_01455 [Fimbriimonas sp.]|jgi:hypothetical protein|nr:hypothetical protein [Fimbriimonas sp.]